MSDKNEVSPKNNNNDSSNIINQPKEQILLKMK
jgi:hypothetical protein